MTPREKTARFFARPDPTDTKPLEDAIIAWIDAIREERGLPPLEEGDGGDQVQSQKPGAPGAALRSQAGP